MSTSSSSVESVSGYDEFKSKRVYLEANACRLYINDDLSHNIVTLRPNCTTKLTIYSHDDFSKLELVFRTNDVGVLFYFDPATTGDAELFHESIKYSDTHLFVGAGSPQLKGKTFWIDIDMF